MQNPAIESRPEFPETVLKTALALREPAEVRKLILKLRWIGQESEAERLCVLLSRVAPGQISVELPPRTD